ncbi:hypothetical protein EVAR_13627_1 [Eumeta japonica]|uniref:Uncharacterized protein n=1 Tax=Eumeta variegata TaxID=151549 RepID=A0A4C1UV89_EUMVA|nr:hypothetical protein EVAR_13627_1 [Eumeta japonica]
MSVCGAAQCTSRDDSYATFAPVTAPSARRARARFLRPGSALAGSHARYRSLFSYFVCFARINGLPLTMQTKHSIRTFRDSPPRYMPLFIAHFIYRDVIPKYISSPSKGAGGDRGGWRDTSPWAGTSLNQKNNIQLTSHERAEDDGVPAGSKAAQVRMAVPMDTAAAGKAVAAVVECMLTGVPRSRTRGNGPRPSAAGVSRPDRHGTRAHSTFGAGRPERAVAHGTPARSRAAADASAPAASAHNAPRARAPLVAHNEGDVNAPARHSGAPVAETPKSGPAGARAAAG